jgi:cytochrome c oxidase assembly factor CtaG
MFTQSKLVLAVEHESLALQALAYSSLQKMVHTHNFVCHQVKLEMLMFVAAPLSVLSETQNNQISAPEKLVALVGRDAAQLFAEL